ncbi:hypothetical protein HispidOSU_011213, partial [Sigmodon hispidus]
TFKKKIEALNFCTKPNYEFASISDLKMNGLDREPLAWEADTVCPGSKVKTAASGANSGKG